jgi:hypothetical protein
MQLSEKHISDFQKLYKRRFGQDISKKEALEKGLMVLKMVKQMALFSLKEERSKKENVDFY